MTQLKVMQLKMQHATNTHKEYGLPMLISYKMDLKTNSITRDKEEYFIMVKRSIHKGKKNSPTKLGVIPG